MDRLPPSTSDPALASPDPGREGKAAAGNGSVDEGHSPAETRSSEIRYRRLFEAARDGILIMDPETRKITDANPFMTELLVYTCEELVGKELWQIGLHKDEDASRATFRELQDRHYVRYDDLPLLGKTGVSHEVEFVSNLYEEDGRKVIQCNIRDVTERRRAENLVQADSSRELGNRKRRSLIDLGVIIAVSIAVFVIGHAYDAFDPLFKTLATADGKIDLDLSETAATALVVCIGLLIFSYRRWNEGRKEVISQKQIAEALRSLQVEMERKAQDRTAELFLSNRALDAEMGVRSRAVQQVTLLDTCIANLNDIILITEAAPIDEPGPRIVFVNEAFERITGYSSAEAIGRSPRFLQGKKTDRRVLREIRAAMERREPVRKEVINYRKDGSEYLMDIDMVPIFDAAGVCTHFAAIEHDVTEQKTAERTLRESERRFREVLENVDLIALTLDKGGIITFCNDYLLTLTGWTQAEIVGQDCFRILVPETELELRRLFDDDLCAGKFPSHYENAIKTKAGELRQIRWSNTMLRDEADHVTGLTAIGEDITEEQKSAEQLLWKTALLEAKIHSSPDGILIVDNEGRKLLQNQKMVDLLGIPQELADRINDGAQLEWVTRQNKDPRQFAEKVAYLSSHPDETSQDEIELLNGKIFDRFSAPAIGKDGTHYGRIWVFRDITERKFGEAALIASENKFRALFDLAYDAIYMLSKGVYVDCNAKGVELFGCGRERIIGRSPGDFAPTVQPDGRDSEAKAEELIKEVVLGKAQFFEWVIRRPDGTQVHVDVSLNKIDLAGEVYVQAIARDITGRKRDEQQIAEQAALLDKAQDAIIVRDLDGAILFWNKGAEKVYGWTREEAIGHNIGDFLYADPQKFEEVNRHTLTAGEWSGVFIHLAKDRRDITVEARWTLIREPDGTPKSVLAIYTDVTEKKKMEAQFLRAQRMESIGTLAGGIAHDLNNILAPIMMAIDILRDESSNARTKQILSTIEVSAKRGADIVRQVLSFARGIEGERLEIQPKHLLDDLEHIIKNTFPKDIRMSFSSSRDIWTILGDPTQVHQILLNLCVNARDAMPNGGTLAVALENCVLDEHYEALNLDAKAGRYVKINVTDSGTGIAPALVGRIFEPFFTTKELNKGTGLGLSTVMAIAKSHGGSITVYSEQGKGTSFAVYLPAMEGSGSAKRDKAETVSLPRGKGEMILIVDDEATILSITSQTLQAFGYKVLIAQDGAIGLALYLQNRSVISLVLTDMMMPVMDGPAMIHALMSVNPAVRIIAASGLNMNGSAAKASGEGVKHFLNKPYTAETLLMTLRKVLDEVQP
jgi:two-component system cell cycle sensor histidine kinase/response regulator CckA